MKRVLRFISILMFAAGICLFLPTAQNFLQKIAKSTVPPHHLQKLKDGVGSINFCAFAAMLIAMFFFVFAGKISEKIVAAFASTKPATVADAVKKPERDSNIELLRCVAMFWIVARHIGLHGVMPFFKGENPYSFVAWRILAFGGGFGNYIFMLISGWFLCKAKFSWKKWLSTYGILLFWTLTVGFLHFFRHIFLYGFDFAELLRLGKSFFPFMLSSNWYASSYLIFYCFLPVLAGGAAKMSRVELKHLCFLSAFLLCFFCYFPKHAGFNPSHVFPFVTFFFIGAYLRLYSPKFFESQAKNAAFALALFGCYAACSFLASYKSGSRIISAIPRFLNPFAEELKIFPVIFAFCFFKNLKIRPSRFINLCGGCTFAIYVIHETPNMHNAWNKVFHIEKFANSPAFVLAILPVAVFAFFACIAAETARKKICIALFNRFFSKDAKKMRSEQK